MACWIRGGTSWVTLVAVGASVSAFTLVARPVGAAVNGITETFETSDVDSYNITDKNPFDDTIPRGAPPRESAETPGDPGSGPYSGLHWMDARNGDVTTRIGFAEEVNNGFQATPVHPNGGNR